MSLQSVAVVFPCTDSPIRSSQWHRLSRPYPVGLKWSRRRLVVTNAAPRRQEPRKEVLLDNQDLMALEFGRLLGESQQKTLSKIVGKKIAPNASYIEIEKQVKSGRRLINKAGFAVTVDGAQEKASSGAQELPRLVSPPSRATGLSVSAPPAGSLGGGRAGSQVDEPGESLDDTLLRKPSSRKHSTAGRVSGVEEGANGGLEKLHKPSTSKAIGVSLGRESLENDEFMEASKAEFQRLLDQSFGFSKASLDLASPPSRQAKPQFLSSLAASSSFETKKFEHPDQLEGSRSSNHAGLSAVEDELSDSPVHPCTESSGAKHHEDLDMAPLPYLSSPPSRKKGPVGTFVQPAGGRTKAPPPPPPSSSSPSIRSLANIAHDELLVSKPRSPATKNAALAPTQQPLSGNSLESTVGVLQYEQPYSDMSLESTEDVLQQEQDSPPLLRLRASRPSRPKPSFGTFVQPARGKTRPSRSTGIDEALDETRLRRPIISEISKDSTATTPVTDSNAEPPSSSAQVVLESKIPSDGLDERNSSKELDESSRLCLENGALPSCEEFPKSKSPIAMGGAIEMGSKLHGASLTGGPRREGQTSEKKSAKVAALKKPVRGPPMSSSAEEGSNNGHLGMKRDSDLEPENESGRIEKETESNEPSKPTESNAEPPSFSTQVVLESKIPNNGLDERNSSKELDESSRLCLENGALLPCEEFPKSKSPIALGGAIEMGSKLCGASLSGGPRREGQTSEKKSAKVVALKKPVRGPPMPSSAEVASNNGHLGMKTDSDLEPENENSRIEKETESKEPTKPTSMVTALPVQSLEENEDRHPIQEHVTDAPTEIQSEESLIARATTANHIEPAVTMEASTSNSSVEQPKEVLRRPSLTAAELLGGPSQHIDILHQAKEDEEKEWARAEALLESKEVVEVKLIGSNSAGLFVLFGCLVGFLPSFELSPRRGLMDFASWAQQRGHGLARMRIGSSPDAGRSVSVAQNSTGTGGELNELKENYKEEVSKLMSSLVGERTRVLVKVLDKSRRKLKFSEKEADPDGQEHAQRKAKLMAELEIGVIVACEVKSITPIGVFVEVDGVSALIHRSEVSWNPKADPAALLSIGQVIKAKVCRLDRTLQRINLSLKQMQTDPLKLTLESVVGDFDRDTAIMPEMDAIETKEEVIWPELEDLIAKLQGMDDISSVLRGRCLYSAAFAPTFQVLISNPQSNGYKLLARFGNKIQEVLVDTTLDRERMKECIRLCTFSVAA